MSEIGQKIIAETRKVAEENPDHVYRGWCQYVADGKPGCIIGHALWNLGFIDAGLEDVGVNEDGADGILDHLNLEVDANEGEWLNRAQEQQDSNIPWSEAVRYADLVGT